MSGALTDRTNAPTGRRADAPDCAPPDALPGEAIVAGARALADARLTPVRQIAPFFLSFFLFLFKPSRTTNFVFFFFGG